MTIVIEKSHKNGGSRGSNPNYNFQPTILVFSRLSDDI